MFVYSIGWVLWHHKPSLLAQPGKKMMSRMSRAGKGWHSRAYEATALTLGVYGWGSTPHWVN